MEPVRFRRGCAAWEGRPLPQGRWAQARVRLRQAPARARRASSARHNGMLRPKGTRSQQFSCKSPTYINSGGEPRGLEEPQGTEGNPRSQRVPGIPRVPRDPPPSLLHEAKYIPSVSVPPCALCALAGEGHGVPRATGRSLGGKGCLSGDRQRGRSVVRARLLVALAAPTRLLSFARLLANSALLLSDETSSPSVFPKGYNGGRHKTAPERGAL